MGCDIHAMIEVRTDKGWEARGGELDIWRNYDLFAILAGVRNRGGRDLNKISEPRGVPTDASEEWLSYVKHWEYDAHSHSYHTLAQLQAFDWNGVGEHEGWVNRDNYKTWKRDGKPEEWCQSVGGGGVRHLTNEQMDAAILDGTATHSDYTHVRWSEPYLQSVEPTWRPVLTLLESVGASPEDVRLVFCFDN